MKEIRKLKANEIECRVGSGGDNGKTWCTLLLYKDARVDQRLLDEVFGQMNWKRDHQLIDGQLFCTVSIWDDAKNQWVSKQDVGTESFTEKEKGRASDAFKRACFNVGIGRELYTAPLVFINLDASEYKNNKLSTRFECTEIGYDEEGNINLLVIVDNKGKERFRMGGKKPAGKPKEAVTTDSPYHKDDVDLVIEIINVCKTRDKIVEVFNANPQFKNDKKLIEACQKQTQKISANA